MKKHYPIGGGPRPEDFLGKRAVVVLIGMQDRFIAKLKPGEADRIILNQLAILKLCRQLDIPVVVSEIKKEIHGATAEVLINEAKKNTRFLLMDCEHNDSFSGTKLDSYLKNFDAEAIFLMGIHDYACIKYTAETAIKKGYKIMTSDEVIAGPYYRTGDNVGQWFEKNGICFRTVDIFPETLAA